MEAQINAVPKHLFDQQETTTEAAFLQGNEIGQTILQISQLVIDFASIERVPRYCPNKRENDVEHSFMLALAGVEIASTYYPGLDSGLIGKLALVHDFPELKTGDVATFDLTDQQMAQKHQNEQANLPQLIEELPPHLADLLTLYEEQRLPEAKFVKHTDKLLPNAVNTSGAGMHVMNEDYDVFCQAQFRQKNGVLSQRYRNNFPDQSHDVLHLAYDQLANRFAETFLI